MTEQQAALIIELLGVPPRLKQAVFEHCGGYSRYLGGDCYALDDALVPPLRAYQRDAAALRERAGQLLEEQAADGVDIVPRGDDRYPRLLSEIHDPPALLFVRGDTAVLECPQIAIVGSRNASRVGVDLAREFARTLAESGFVVTSGGALGVDGAAHRGALAGGRTVAVLGAGIDVIYPRRHGALFAEIAGGRGALISELPPGTPPLPHNFPRRNRIISGLCLGVLVVEAAPKSGSLITARLAMEQGREVFAIPGSIHNPSARGCHQLIREGAAITETVDDIVAQLGGLLAFKAESLQAATGPAEPVSTEESAVLEQLGFDPVDYDTLARLTRIDPASLTALLVSLEIQGFIENRSGVYQRLR